MRNEHPFQIGDYVTCIRPGSILELDQTYIVTGTLIDDDNDAMVRVKSVSLTNPYESDKEPGWLADRFVLDQFRTEIARASTVLPCPFCGTDPVVLTTNGVTLIYCNNRTGKTRCAAHPKVQSLVTQEEPNKNTELEAIQLWNKRS